MKTVYLHIGTMKTGTTYIQTCLYKQKNLLEQINYLYPENGLISFGHHNLFFELKEERNAKPSFGLFVNLIKEIENSPCEKCIVSSEGFIKFKYDEILLLKNILEEYFKVIIIVSFRRQDDYLASIWSHDIINSQIKLSFPDFINDTIRIGNSTKWKSKEFYPYYDYYYDLWGDIFGEDNIRVLLYDLQHKNLLIDFLKLCDIKEKRIWEALLLKKRRNKSPSYNLLELCRSLHNNYSDKVPKVTKLVVNKAIKRFAAENNSKSGKNGYVDKVMSEKIMDHFGVSNTNLAEKINKSYPLFSERAIFGSMKINIDNPELSSSDYSEMLLAIINRLSHSGLLRDKLHLRDEKQQFLIDNSSKNI